MSTIAVDAMGGDHAPRQVVLGALRALGRDRRLRVALVGQSAVLRSCLADAGRRALDGRPEAPVDSSTDRLTIVHATGAVPMDAAPVAGLGILFVSVLRPRMEGVKSDRYTKEIHR